MKESLYYDNDIPEIYKDILMIINNNNKLRNELLYKEINCENIEK